MKICSDSTMLIGKTISNINVDGFGITLFTDDGYCLEYNASDGGYSSYEITHTEREKKNDT